MKCDKCGYEGSRGVFKFIRPIEPGIRDSYRRCPKCEAEVLCDEAAEDEKSDGKLPWGFKALGKKSVRGMDKDADV